jgi:hypothetical protein
MELKYPFSITKSIRCESGKLQSEMTFEGIVMHSIDKEIEHDYYYVAAELTGFTQYQDGNKIAGIDSLLIPAHRVVVDMDAFEAECIKLAVPNVKTKCEECNGNGIVEKTIYTGDEGMEIEMDVMVECRFCDGSGKV